MEKIVNLKIKTIDELKFVCNDKIQDFFIQLNYNLITRKRIFYDHISDLFFVEDLVTSSNQTYTLQQLKNDTNIINAVEKGSFYLKIDENTASSLRISMALADSIKFKGI